MRTETREIPWEDGSRATLTIRSWSFRERDIWERKWGANGDQWIGAIIGVLQSPKSPGAKGMQLARALVDDQRQRFDLRGRGPDLEKVATVLVRVALSDGTEWPAPAIRESLEALDADLFDAIAAAVDDVLGLRE